MFERMNKWANKQLWMIIAYTIALDVSFLTILITNAKFKGILSNFMLWVAQKLFNVSVSCFQGAYCATVRVDVQWNNYNWTHYRLEF